MAGIRKLPSGRYQAWFTDWQGSRVFFTHGTNPKEARHVADNLENTHRRARLGEIPPPKSSDIPRSFAEVAEEYLAWGKAQGGHGGRQWSPVHVKMRTRHLTEYWPEQLHPQTFADVTLPKVETVTRTLLKTSTGKTVQMHVESMKALCIWAKERGYLDSNPLEGMAPFDVTPKEKRRALTVEELAALLAKAPADRRIVYEVAACTGYRKGELTALKVADLDFERNTLPLAAEFTKGRRDARQPIPAALAEKLKAVTGGKEPDAPLMFVDFHIDRLFKRDCIKAGIAPKLMGAVVVFHSLRHTYCTFVIDSGASLTEAQRLMRHTDPKLTANTYSHARQDRLQTVAEAVGDLVFFEEKCAPSVHALAAGAENTLVVSGCDDTARGSIPFTRLFLPQCTIRGQHPRETVSGDGPQARYASNLPKLSINADCRKSLGFV